MRKPVCLHLIGVLLLITSLSQAQQGFAPNLSDYSKITDILPPSPNAASLGKYGGIDVGLNTGTSNIGISIYNFVSNNLKVPVSIQYSSNGFRVDELPGRVGTGWSLNAGGVITRTVYGSADDRSQRVVTPPDFPAQSRALVDFMESLASPDGYPSPVDGQPDVFNFNFNGYTGRFIVDNNLNPLPLAHTNLKIQTSFSSTDWNFKITTPDGIQYFFGGSEATERSKKTQTGAGCGKHNTTFVATAWYLKQIIHPNNDIITFTYSYIGMTYSAGISETIYNRREMQDLTEVNCYYYDVNAPNLNNTTCENLVQVEGRLLEEINSTAGTKLKLTYTNRSDCNDRLLSAIDIYAPGQVSPIRTFSLNYQYSVAANFTNAYSTSNTSLKYRPFLTSFSEKSNDGSLTKNYSFSYNDINSLPPRLSFAQDHHGYFNGKNNATLIPLPSSLSWQQKFPTATANREIDPVFCQKGLLSAITYPTGGKDNIFYEGNQIYEQVATYPSQSSINAGATNPSYQGGAGTTAYSANAVNSYQQEVMLSGQCISNSTTGGDAIHDQCTISVLNENNTVIFSIFLVPGNSFNQVLNLDAGHTYRVKSNVNGDNVSGGATLYCRPGNITYQYMNKNAGGVRVSKAVSTDAATNVPVIKKYLYHKLNAPGISSAGKIYTISVYEKYLKVYIPCKEGVLKPGVNPNGLNADCGVPVFGYSSMYSNTLNNIYLYPASQISYSSVIESFGENYENGGIEHQFSVYEDVPAYPLIGDGLFFGAPMSNYSWRNGREIYQHIFKMSGSTYTPVKKVFINYKEDTRVNQEIKAYALNKKYRYYCQDAVPRTEEINAYDLLTFSFLRKWAYVDSVRTWTYDINGQNYSEQINISEYANVTHALPTKQLTFESDKISSSVTSAYPQDITLTGAEETARQSLISKYIIGPVLQQQVFKGATQIYTLKTGYNVFSNGLVLPYTQNTQKASSSMEERVRYYSYDNYGKITEQAKASDARQSYIWDYQSSYPVASVQNASPANIAYTSFETDNKGNWNSYTGTITTVTATPFPPTGKKYYNITASSTLSKAVTNGAIYTVSYWRNNTSPYTINGGTATVQTGKTINGWTYHEHRVTASSTTLTITGSGGIDEVRLYPEKAQMVSTTYDPLIGITSQCDAGNNITYYEYDGLGRLVLIRDQDRNILKKICYNYAGQAENCIGNTNPFWQSTGLTRCQPCPGNAAYTNGIQEHQEKDNNTSSATYNTLRWVSDGASGNCAPAADWQFTATAIRCKLNAQNQNTGEQEREQRDMNPCSSTYNQLRWIVTGSNTTACPLPDLSPMWQPTGNSRCKPCPANSAYISNIKEREEKDNNPNSESYNSLRWITEGASGTCVPPADWQFTATAIRCKKTAQNQNTGEQEREQRDMNPCSSTYNQTRWIVTATNTTACPLPDTNPLWQSTGNTRCKPCPANNAYISNVREREEKDNNPNSATYNTLRWVTEGVSNACVPPADWQFTTTPIRCKKTAQGNNTGEQEREQRDMNPCSSTYNQTRWIVTATNTTACPLPPVCTTSNCTGVNKKCINGVCETGIKVYTVSIQKPDGSYRCTYHYEWSDGSWSDSFIETRPAGDPCPCGC